MLGSWVCTTYSDFLSDACGVGCRWCAMAKRVCIKSNILQYIYPLVKPVSDDGTVGCIYTPPVIVDFRFHVVHTPGVWWGRGRHKKFYKIMVSHNKSNRIVCIQHCNNFLTILSYTEKVCCEIKSILISRPKYLSIYRLL